jgi:LAO/AO transport system kinase
LIETVGAGQAEVEIAGTAHTTVVIEAPGMGDEIQSIKAGILEIADILVVNKADRPGASNAVKALRMMIHMGMKHEADDLPSWNIPVLETTAHEGGGVAILTDSLQKHFDFLKESGQWQDRERNRISQEINQILQARFMAQFQSKFTAEQRQEVVDAVVDRELDPYSAVSQLLDSR